MRVWVGTGLCLVLLAFFGASSAVAATTSWEWITTTEYPWYAQYYGQTVAGGGPTEPHEYVLANTGESPITIERLSIGWESKAEPHVWTAPGGDCKKGTTIEPGGTCSVDMVFDPLMAGWREGWIRAQAADEQPEQAKVILEAKAVGPWVEPEPERLDFGSVQVGAGPSAIQTITLTDEESLPLKIYGISVTDIYERPESPSPFRVVGGSCREGVVVATSESCTIEVVLEPAKVGSFESKIVIADNAESEQSVLVRGVGVAPPPPSTGSGTVTKSEPDSSVPSPPPSPSAGPPTVSKTGPLVCPKGKRKAVRRGRTVCERRPRHHHHRRSDQRPVAEHMRVGRSR
ncbi:MAG TPA: choice-of-anchor D domain-containing protein [Solirubrobacterales bacterium]|nr:choice-of-anchor D domain-containing protein [Solirubrobacterales bacterium]